MKIPKEWVKEYANMNWSIALLVEKVQNEAWNEAIEAAAKETNLFYREILKLKK